VAINLITIGKLKNPHIQALEHHYLKQLSFFKLVITELKSHAEDSLKEELQVEELILKKKLKNIYLLNEHSKHFDSKSFAKFLEKKPDMTLVISGAQGFSEQIKKKYPSLSLSPLTFAHKLARLILIEQIYRAQTLLTGHPYHN
jgi:23S rRNA (pseudouridine1915-N3)-methyltransferase